MNQSANLEQLSQVTQQIKALKARSLSTRKAIDNQDLKALSKTIQEVVDRCLQHKKVEHVLRSLHFEHIAERKADIKLAHKNTFKWSLSKEKATLASWLESENGVYWIAGKAGCGKSTLMKYLENDPQTAALLTTWAGDKPLLIASHYFWALGTGLQKGLQGLLRTLLFQAFMEQPDLIQICCAHRLDASKFRYLESWTVEELTETFQKLSTSKDLRHKICFFIDGLDEFRGGTCQELVDTVNRCALGDNIKFCVSSRGWTEFETAYGKSKWSLRVHDLTREDIDTYVKDQLGEDTAFMKHTNCSAEEVQSLVQEVATRAEGVFLWVYLVMRNLLRGITKLDDISILRQRLAEFPPDLDLFFAYMLDSIDKVYYAETSAIFNMLRESPAYTIPIDVITAYRAFQQSSYHPHQTKNELITISEVEEELKMKDYEESIHNGGHGEKSVEFVLPRKGPTPKIRIQDKRMSARKVNDIFSKIRSDTAGTSNLLNDPQLERNRIMNRCGDLIQVFDVGEGEEKKYRVGLLHRSVADFFELPAIQKVIQRRSKPGFQVQEALVEAYAALIEISYSKTISEIASLKPIGGEVSHVETPCTIPSQNLYWLVYWMNQVVDKEKSWYTNMLLCLFKLQGLQGLDIPLETSLSMLLSINRRSTDYLRFQKLLPYLSDNFDLWAVRSCLLKPSKQVVLRGEQPEVDQGPVVDLRNLYIWLEDSALGDKGNHTRVLEFWIHFVYVTMADQTAGRSLPNNIDEICDFLLAKGGLRKVRLSEAGLTALEGFDEATRTQLKTAVSEAAKLTIENHKYTQHGQEVAEVNTAELLRSLPIFNLIEPRRFERMFVHNTAQEYYRSFNPSQVVFHFLRGLF